MEFNFFLGKLAPAETNNIAVLDAKNMKQPTRNYAQFHLRNFSGSSNAQSLDQVLDRMGEASAIAQELKQIITTASRFYGTDQRIYLKIEGKVKIQMELINLQQKCLGLLKIGKKNLFHRDHMGNIKEICPLCILDFYVHESVQRQGIGKELFDYMLEREPIQPHQLGYDRPSPKLLGFLRKYYNLSNYVPQNNNFVIFNQYWGTLDQQQLSQQPSKSFNRSKMSAAKYQPNQEIDSLNLMMQELSIKKNQNAIQYQPPQTQYHQPQYQPQHQHQPQPQQQQQQQQQQQAKFTSRPPPWATHDYNNNYMTTAKQMSNFMQKQ